MATITATLGGGGGGGGAGWSIAVITTAGQPTVSSTAGALDDFSVASTATPGEVQLTSSASILNNGVMGEQVFTNLIVAPGSVTGTIVIKGAGKGR